MDRARQHPEEMSVIRHGALKSARRFSRTLQRQSNVMAQPAAKSAPRCMDVFPFAKAQGTVSAVFGSLPSVQTPNSRI
jgi:hypothetical protein